MLLPPAMSMSSPMPITHTNHAKYDAYNGKHGLHSNDDDDSNDYTNDLRLQLLLVLLQVTELRNQLPKFSYTYT